MKQKVIILDIKKNIHEDEVVYKLAEHKPSSVFIGLTPYSFYIFDKLDLKYKSLHSFMSVKTFSKNVLLKIEELDKRIPIPCVGLMMEFIKLISYVEYEILLRKIYTTYKNDEIIYIADIDTSSTYDFTNNTSLFNCVMCKKISIDRIEFNKNKINNRFRYLSISKVTKKMMSKVFKLEVGYDWHNFLYFIKKTNNTHLIFNKFQDRLIDMASIKRFVEQNIESDMLKKYFYLYIDQFNKKLTVKKIHKIFFFTWVSSFEEFISACNNFSIFYQHGNYYYKNMIFKYSEIIPSNINFVFNDYTKNLFEDLGAKKVYSVGSILFNQSIKEKKKKYDFLYITQGHDYTGNLQYVDFPNSLHSFDGYELYQRHKNIIKLFGTKFKEKKILIRVHPTVVTTGVYVPFWELAEDYPNITIDVSIPIHTLIEQSKYIISDYFTTEFINRELHYKRDIILFQGVPTPLPKETLEDMKKMFILVDTIDDLKEKIENIEKITKNRKRYDDIIEYYSSKKCDTKKVVTEILKKELK